MADDSDRPVGGGEPAAPLLEDPASRRGRLFDSEESEVDDCRRLRVFGLAGMASGWGSSGMRTADDIIVAALDDDYNE